MPSTTEQPDTAKSTLAMLPDDAERALLVGRAWSESAGGPLPLLIRRGRVYDLSAFAPTVSALFEMPDVAGRLESLEAPEIGNAECAFSPPRWENTQGSLRLLAPFDLQCIKACGVTFAVSVMERVVEEQARGDPAAAAQIRADLTASLGDSIAHVEPGSEQAEAVKQYLVEAGLWSQYLEVAIGPDAEVFTKAPVLSAVGWGDWIGIRDDSHWNNSEPEVVLACSSAGQIIGACLGNDMNLRDFEGRSALLLGKAKDNNASAALGPFVRIFDRNFTLEDLVREPVSLAVEGADGFSFREQSSMNGLSRSPQNLVAQALGKHHQYPDGLVLYLGSLIAPTQDRDEPGKGFTHHPGDCVRITSPRLGSLLNKVGLCSELPEWRFGISALMSNLAARGLLPAS